MNKTIRKILIANRGEIACRIIRTLDKMGIESVAVHSDADRDALHVKLATRAVHIGPSPAIDSYLVIDKIINAAKNTGADAIHPGYGFLSENPLLAEACQQAGILFIGPPAAAIRAMGSKSAAKRIMEKSGVPLIPGYHGDNQQDEVLRSEAGRIGYPVILKAALGGGGKGMRVVNKAEEFDGALASCRREAQSAFNDSTILIEKYIGQPRHVEIQVFCDTHGNGVHLFERDCSIQRRHQKIIEEAPAPDIPADIRANMARDALLAAKAIDYVGAGTVEFLYDGKGQYYFMEMNTRLQVEHPVTEMITGQDLVQWQVDVASGKPLPCTQAEIRCHGHSIESRICAEDGDNNFMPSIGPLQLVSTPRLDETVRLDAGIHSSDEISVYYDPMFAKLIVWGRDRAEAIRKMEQALDELRITGVETNIAYLQGIFTSERFRNLELTTHFLDNHQHAKTGERENRQAAIAAAAFRMFSHDRTSIGTNIHLPYGWRMNASANQQFSLEVNQDSFELRIQRQADEVKVSLDDTNPCFSVRKADPFLHLTADGNTEKWFVHESQDDLHLFNGPHRFHVRPRQASTEDADASGHAHLVSPMPGIVTKLFVATGDQVKTGDPLVVVEAMKMEHVICANRDGVVEAVVHAVGDSVTGGVELITLGEPA